MFFALLFAVQIDADTGAVLYQAWCKNCHGVDGRGTASSMVRVERPPADLAECKTSSAEPQDQWVDIVTMGGAAFGLSLDMPAFGEGATREQIRAIVRYVRSLCGQPGWPPGELNFPRAFLVEKAFPENEVVLVNEGRGQEYIYERRLGKRLQLELLAKSVFDSAGRPFDGAGAALKYNLWHDLNARALVSAGLEVVPPVGRQAVWEAEPFVTFGAEPLPGVFTQAEVVATLAEGEGFAAWSYRAGVGRELGRLVPMLEAGWDVPTGGAASTLTLYPQVWIQLSRLGHVAASVGAALPATGPGSRDARLIAFVLWDFGDGPLFRGW